MGWFQRCARCHKRKLRGTKGQLCYKCLPGYVKELETKLGLLTEKSLRLDKRTAPYVLQNNSLKYELEQLRQWFCEKCSRAGHTRCRCGA